MSSKFLYITPDDVRFVVRSIVQQHPNLSKEELDAAVRDTLSRIDFEKHQEWASEHPVKNWYYAMEQRGSELLGSKFGGLDVLIPGRQPILEELKNMYMKGVSKEGPYASETLRQKGGIFDILAATVPNVADTLLSLAAGQAMRMGSASYVVPAASGIITAADDIASRLRAYGVDDDIAETVARRSLWKVAAPSGLFSIGLAAPIGGTSLLKGVARETLAVGGGAAESGLYQHLMGGIREAAFQAMRERHGRDWQPTEIHEPSVAEAAKRGLAMTIAGRVVTHAAFAPFRYMTALREQRVIEDEAAQTFEHARYALERKEKIHALEVKIQQELDKPKSQRDVSKIKLWEKAIEKVRQTAEQKGDELITPQPQKPVRALPQVFRDWIEELGQKQWTAEEKIRRLRKLPYQGLLTLYGRLVKQGEGETVVGHSKEELVSLLSEKLGLIREGPHYIYQRVNPNNPHVVRKVLSLETPVLDYVPDALRRWGETVDLATRKAIQNLGLLPDKANILLWELRRRSLKYAGLRDELAKHPELNDAGKVRVDSPDQGLAEKLTGTQYVKYVSHLEGLTYKLLARRAGRIAASKYDATIYSKWTPPPVLDANGKPVSGMVAENFPIKSITGWFGKIRPFAWMFMKLENATGLPLVRLDNAMRNGLRRSQEYTARIGLAMVGAAKNLPPPLKRGVVGRHMQELAAFFMVGEDEQRQILRQLNEQRTAEGKPRLQASEVWKHVYEVLREKDAARYGLTPEKVVGLAKELAARYSTVFSWIHRAGGVEWEHFRDKYLPLIRYLNANKKDSMVSIGEWIAAKQDDILKSLNITDSEELMTMAEMLDTMYAFKKSAKINADHPMYEYFRTADAEALAAFNRILDPYQLMGMWLRMNTRKLFLAELLPTFAVTLENAAKELTAKGYPSAPLRDVVHDYLHSVFSFPETENIVAKRLSIVSRTSMLGKALYKTAETWNKHFGYLMEMHIPSVEDMMNGLMTFFYVKSLGLPNLKVPMQNLFIQNLLSVVYGPKNFLAGMWELVHNPEVREEVSKYHIEKDSIVYRERSKLKLSASLEKTASWLMTFHSASDLYARYGAASTALVLWSKLEPFLQKYGRNVPKEIVDRVLFRKERNVKLNDEVIYKYSPERTKQLWTGKAQRGFSALSNAVYEHIRRGNMDDAKELFVRYCIELTQWRYGPGGSPYITRTPLARLMFMFFSYPANYTEYMAWLLNPKNQLAREAFNSMTAQLMMGMFLASVGINPVRWVLFGPAHESVGFTGIAYDLVQTALDAMQATGRAVSAQVLPVNDELKKRYETEMKNAVQQFFHEANPLPYPVQKFLQ
ncbi:MAG: hypothetical protein QXT73_01305 [Candidatus Methanomethylicaceae archaeon]